MSSVRIGNAGKHYVMACLLVFPNKHGSEPKWSAQRVIWLRGERRPDNIAYGFREDWVAY